MNLNLTELLKLVEEMPAFRQLIEKIKRPDSTIHAVVLDSAKPYVLAALHRTLHIPILMVTAQPDSARKLYEQVAAWSGLNYVKLFPEPDVLPYQKITSPDSSTEAERLQTLAAMTECKAPLIVTSIPALVHKTMSKNEFIAAYHAIKQDMEIKPHDLLRRWEAMGYRMETTVEVPGTMSYRGGIVDIYPPTSDLPARLEFFGNTVESIRLFDPISQRSISTVKSISIAPATELLPLLTKSEEELETVLSSLDISVCTPEIQDIFRQEQTMLCNKERLVSMPFYGSLFNRDSILSYLSKDSLLVLDEPRSLRQSAEIFDTEAVELRSQRLDKGELPANYPRPYFTWEELSSAIEQKLSLVFSELDIKQGQEPCRLGFSTAPSYGGQLPVFVNNLKQLIKRKRRLILTSYQASRLSELFEEEGIFTSPTTDVKQIPAAASLTLVQGSLGAGWVMGNDTYLLTDAEIFGFVKQQRLIKKRPVPRHKLYVDIKPGDYVVHIEHGIAKFHAVARMGEPGKQKEYLVLHYAAGDKLFVPTDQIDRVSRYVGSGDQPPVLSRLGTQEWSKTKKAVKESVQVMAKDLLALYAAREVVSGFAFSPDTVWQKEFEAAFPYVETPDQITVQGHVKENMEEEKPMDRLVCGDVGYGKTEVAIRAAFKAVMDGKQVAVLVPTTVLAQQHYSTFSQRMEAFPVKVEVLSRFKTAREQKNVLEKLAQGNVDIVIGTHRLLQKDVVFKNLGLLVIDEEQRFGVAHKEYLKKLRQEVDVLTLSATPIPRTLHMALAGVKDMSTMETPPEERLPIKTYVAEFDDRLVREAILKELERNGQVFFVHNRVQSITMIASKIRELVPEARVLVAHGQMPEDKLEEVMTDFVQEKADVLVCTTIIESGLDMPKVNTLIVNKADRFGLTQLYQLRGRVGRGANLAYAYFLYDKEKRLTPMAEKRLKTIFEATELGAGFSIAMKDLEIRGAGSLLGTQQSGYISAVGLDLYSRLLSEAVEELKTKKAGDFKPKEPRLPEPSINLPLPAFIPADYVVDEETRLSLYQSLVKLDTLQKVEAMMPEFNDRFGKLPPEVKNLLYAVRVKILATQAGIESITMEDGQIVLRRFQGMQFDGRKLEPAIKSTPREAVKVGINQVRLTPRRLGGKWQEVLEELLKRAG